MSRHAYDAGRDRLEECVAERLMEGPPFLDWHAAETAAEAATDTMLSFGGLMAIAEQLLDERYPADVRLVCDPNSPDPGPRLAAALRDCLEAQR